MASKGKRKTWQCVVRRMVSLNGNRRLGCRYELGMVSAKEVVGISTYRVFMQAEFPKECQSVRLVLESGQVFDARLSWWVVFWN